MKIYRFVAAIAMPLALTSAAFGKAPQSSVTMQTDKQLKQQEKADKAQAKADKDARKAANTEKAKKARKSQAKADAEAAKADNMPQNP